MTRRGWPWRERTEVSLHWLGQAGRLVWMAAGPDCSQHSLWIAELCPVSYVQPPEPGAAVLQFVLCIKACWDLHTSCLFIFW